MNKIKINLLPHREEKRKELKNNFYSMLMLAAIVGAAFVLLVGMLFSARLSAQSERNAFIAKANLELDEKIKEVATLKQEIDGLKARQQAVEDLQGDRNQPVYMLNELVKLAPEGLYLNIIKQSGQQISIKGYAQSHDVVRIFVKSLGESKWISNPEIVQNIAMDIGKGKELKRVIEFELNVGIRRPRELEAIESESTQGKLKTTASLKKAE
jgi:type IV pilus assembly protein PilN